MSATDWPPIRYVTTREPVDPRRRLQPVTLTGDYGPVLVYAEFPGGRTEPVAHVNYHSPTGMEYGYAGSGPADMALSILAHFYRLDAKGLARKIHKGGRNLTESEQRAIRWHQAFKFAHIAKTNRLQPLIIYVGEIVRFIADQIQEEGGIPS